MNTTTDVTATAPLAHHEAMALQREELARAVGALRGLTPEQWATRTDCPAWDVREMYLHVLGACEAGASMRENAHQLRVAMSVRRKQGIPLEAALSSTQVAERQTLSPTELVHHLERVAPGAIKGRSRLPKFVRSAIRMKVDAPVVERWKLGYLIDTIYMRDLWMHRIDLARAVGGEPQLDATHDGRIVADVVAEWARRHGKPFELTLTGPAGGHFSHGVDGDRLTLDAVQFCRVLAGRDRGDGLLTQIVPF